jgi:hypothetical protein
MKVKERSYTVFLNLYFKGPTPFLKDHNSHTTLFIPVELWCVIPSFYLLNLLFHFIEIRSSYITASSFKMCCFDVVV